jgi:hypothetical protein
MHSKALRTKHHFRRAALACTLLLHARFVKFLGNYKFVPASPVLLPVS